MSLNIVTVSPWFISGPETSTTGTSAAAFTVIEADDPTYRWYPCTGIMNIDAFKQNRRAGSSRRCMLGRERHPSGIAAAPDASVHPDVKVADARLPDNTRASEIALHRGWQVREVRVADRLHQRDARKRAIDVAVVRGSQADWPLRQKAEGDAKQRNEVAECAELRVAPRRRR